MFEQGKHSHLADRQRGADIARRIACIGEVACSGAQLRQRCRSVLDAALIVVVLGHLGIQPCTPSSGSHLHDAMGCSQFGQILATGFSAIARRCAPTFFVRSLTDRTPRLDATPLEPLMVADSRRCSRLALERAFGTASPFPS